MTPHEALLTAVRDELRANKDFMTIDARAPEPLALMLRARLETLGFAIVPIKPTDEMRDTGWYEFWEHKGTIADTWCAMVRAAS